MIFEGKDYLIRKRETLDDLFANQVVVNPKKERVANEETIS
jgi:hypothetical protein